MGEKQIVQVAFPPNPGPPKLLFHHIEQCQEIALTAQNLYTQEQLITNTIHLLLQLGIFSMKEFKDWESTMVKTWPMLKMFIHSVYGGCLVAVQLQDRCGQQGYVPTHNMYNVLSACNGNTDINDNATARTITKTAVATTKGSTLGNTYVHTNASVHSKLSTTINQLLVNQAALYHQMAALSFHAPVQINNMFQVPSIQTLIIPGIPPPFAIGGATLGRSTCGGKHREGGCGNSGCGRTPFADHMAGHGGGLKKGGSSSFLKCHVEDSFGNSRQFSEFWSEKPKF
jgi:hypothetical protein